MLNRDDVVAAYRYLLGREPENEDVIAYHSTHDSFGALRREILQSEEFSNLYGTLDAAMVDPLTSDPFPPSGLIETEATGSDRDKMWARVAESWRKLGEEAPHWSVLTLEQYRPESFETNASAFFETVSLDNQAVDAALTRLPNADTIRNGLCIEVGCGVGRATRGLAERFAQVLAVDVSAPHLDIAKQEMTAEGYTNVAFRCAETIEDYASLGEASFFYSRIVFQHNPPPVQAAILKGILQSFPKSGVVLFQFVSHIIGYSFTVQDYLAGHHEGMEMHVFPQRSVFDILRENNFEVIEIDRDDNVVGDSRYRSHMVLACKKG